MSPTLLSGASCPNCALGQNVAREFWRERPDYYAAILLLPFCVVLLASRLMGKLGWFEGRP